MKQECAFKSAFFYFDKTFSMTTFDQFFAWIEKLVHAPLSDAVRSLILLALVFVIHSLILRLITRNRRLTLEMKRQWALNFRNVAFVIVAVGLVLIWAEQIHTLALSMAAAAVAVAVSLRELIACSITAVMRTVSNNYKLGDYIQVGRFRGRVTDINLLTTTLMEMGPGNAFQYSGKEIIFPNSILFSEPVIRLDSNLTYVAHTFEIPVPYAFPVNLARQVLMDITHDICNEHFEPAKRYMARLERRHLADTPAVEPRFSIFTVDEKFYKLSARVVVPQAHLLQTEQEIVFRFLKEIQPLLPPPPPPPAPPWRYPDFVPVENPLNSEQEKSRDLE